jgi:hypothetical protein
MLIPVIPVEKAVHEKTSMLLQVQRVDGACAGVVPAGEVGDGDGDGVDDSKQGSVYEKAAIWS